MDELNFKYYIFDKISLQNDIGGFCQKPNGIVEGRFFDITLNNAFIYSFIKPIGIDNVATVNHLGKNVYYNPAFLTKELITSYKE